MCGTDTPWLAHMAANGVRTLRRDFSNTSSVANNFHAAAARCVNDLAEQQHHHVDCSVFSSSTDISLQPCFTEVQQQAPPSQLLLGTSAGLFVVDLQTQSMELLGLPGTPVGHVCYSNGLVLASSPFVEDANHDKQQQADAAALAGLYCLKMGSSSTSDCSPLSDTCTPARKLWQGNARCAAFAAPAAPGNPPRIYVGVQPVDLLSSDDLGHSWSNSGLAEAPVSGSWYRMLPPYEPSVRSISISGTSNSSSSSSSSSNSSTESIEQTSVQQQVLVGVEVGGALMQSPSSPTASGFSSQQAAWTECSQGLCRDVQALQADPFSASKLYAVAGSGSLPGGIYRSRGKGQKWKRLFGYRYPVSMAISSYQKGRLMLVSADKPPEIGCNLFDSTDGGRHWVNVTDYVSDAVNTLTEYAPGVLEHAPVAMFVPGALVLGCVTGHVFMAQAKPEGGFSNWQLLTKLPAAVHCMCMTDDKVAPVALQRA